jgi:hypothetical protein
VFRIGRLSRGSRYVIGALFLQRIKHNIIFLTAKVQVAERALGDAEGQLEKVYQRRRSKNAITGLPAEFLDPRSGIYSITQKDDLFLDRAHFAGYYRAAVQSGPAMYRRAEIAHIDRAQRCQSVEGLEASADTVRIRYTVCQSPGRDQLIADISVDFAIGSYDRLSDIDDKAIDQAVEGELSKPLGERGRALYIDEQKHALLQPWPVIVAGNEIEQHFLSEEVVDVIDESDG